MANLDAVGKTGEVDWGAVAVRAPVGVSRETILVGAVRASIYGLFHVKQQQRSSNIRFARGLA